MCYIYILQMSTGRYYTGITKNINRRLDEHRKGQSKSTQRYLPIKLIFLTTVSDRIRARKLEVKIKNQGARKFIIMNKFEGKYINHVL